MAISFPVCLSTRRNARKGSDTSPSDIVALKSLKSADLLEKFLVLN